LVQGRSAGMRSDRQWAEGKYCMLVLAQSDALIHCTEDKAAAAAVLVGVTTWLLAAWRRVRGQTHEAASELVGSKASEVRGSWS
jgi:hypothetical protein